jgi:hypothetical protein
MSWQREIRPTLDTLLLIAVFVAAALAIGAFLGVKWYWTQARQRRCLCRACANGQNSRSSFKVKTPPIRCTS